MPTTIIDSQYEDGKALIDYLTEQKQPSLQTEAERNFAKNMLLSSASYLEKETMDVIFKFIEQDCSENGYIISIIKNLCDRKFHALFDWASTNANKFFALFGKEFKDGMQQKIQDDEDFKQAICSFLEIGRLRNAMVHQNLANYDLNKTAAEVYHSHKKATYFIEVLRQQLGSHNN
jgi:hypothetical protein